MAKEFYSDDGTTVRRQWDYAKAGCSGEITLEEYTYSGELLMVKTYRDNSLVSVLAAEAGCSFGLRN